jgi:hypothetical protein
MKGTLTDPRPDKNPTKDLSAISIDYPAGTRIPAGLFFGS